MDLIMAIIGLCHISVGGMGMTPEKVDEAQLGCQKYYTVCMSTVPDPTASPAESARLMKCVLAREATKGK